MERHDLATLENGMLQRSIVDAPSVALALMSWRDGKLTERPRVLVAQERNLGLGVGFAERDCGDQFSLYLANEPTPRERRLAVSSTDWWVAQ